MAFDLTRLLWDGASVRTVRPARTAQRRHRGTAVELTVPIPQGLLGDDVRRVRLGGCLVDLVTETQLRRLLVRQLTSPAGTRTRLVASANLDHITHFGGSTAGDGLDPGRMDDWLVLLDGAPMVRAARHLTRLPYPRLAGSDLLPDLFTLAEANGRSVAVLGGRPEICAPLAEAVRRNWPGLRVVGHLTPTRAELLDPESSRRIQTHLADLAPDLLVVGLGKPLQEQWMAEYGRGTGARIVVAFGAAIDFMAGTTPRAPRWMRRTGLEWSFRLLREPRRMARRYLVQGPAAMVRLRRDRRIVPRAEDGTATPGTGPAVGAPDLVTPGLVTPGLVTPGLVTPGPVTPDAAAAEADTVTPDPVTPDPVTPDPVTAEAAPMTPDPETPTAGACTAVIVTYQSARHIRALLESLRVEREAGLDLDVMVVDNASTDRTVEVVGEFDGVRLVSTGGNLGYAAGVNAGCRLVPADRAVLVLNPDVIPAPGAIRELLAGLDAPDVGVVLPQLADGHGILYPSLRNEPSVGRALVDALLGQRAAVLPAGCSGMVWNSRHYQEEQSPDWATGAALLISGACRAAVGEWDERYFLYSEETDFFHRARAAGFRIRYLPGSRMQHVGGGSGVSDGLYALCVVNSVRYYQRYHPRRTAAAFTAVTVLHQVTRSRRPAARLAVRALLSRRIRATLPAPTTPSDGPGHPRA